MHNLRETDESLADFVPFGFIVDGSQDEDSIEIDKAGTMWMKTDAWNIMYN